MFLKNMLSMSALNMFKAASSFLVSAAIARSVPPAQYGLVAVALPFVTFLTVITDLGLTSAVVREPRLDSQQAGAIFSFMTVIGVASAVLLIATAGILESGLRLPGLSGLLKLFAIVAFLSIFAAAPKALLERDLRYTALASIEFIAIVSALGAFVVGIRSSQGVYALLWFHLALQATRGVGFAWVSRSKYIWSLNGSRIKSLIHVSTWILATNLLSYAARNVGTLVVGALLGATAVGLYGLSQQFMILPLMLISWPISGVLLSTLSRMSDTTESKGSFICSVISATTAVSFPLMTLLSFALAFPLMSIYGAKWDGLADLVTWMAPVGAIQSIASYNGAVLVQLGKLRLNFALSCLNGLGLSSIFVFAKWLNLSQVIKLYCGSAVLVSAILIYFTCKAAGISARSFFYSISLGVSGSMLGLVITTLVPGTFLPSLHSWLISIFAFVSTVLLSYLLMRKQVFAVLTSLAVRHSVSSKAGAAGEA